MNGLSVFRHVNANDYSEPMPQYPARTLLIHVIAKGIQGGSVIGLFATPIYSNNRKKTLMTSWRTCMISSGVFGVVASLGLVFVGQQQGKFDVAGVDDRAYRIKNSKSQSEVDFRTAVAGIIGATVSAITTGKASNVLPATLTAVSGGLIYHLAKPHVEKLFPQM